MWLLSVGFVSCVLAALDCVTLTDKDADVNFLRKFDSNVRNHDAVEPQRSQDDKTSSWLRETYRKQAAVDEEAPPKDINGNSILSSEDNELYNEIIKQRDTILKRSKNMEEVARSDIETSNLLQKVNTAGQSKTPEGTPEEPPSADGMVKNILMKNLKRQVSVFKREATLGNIKGNS